MNIKKFIVGAATGALMLGTMATSAFAASVNVYNLQPDWTAPGGGGVYSAYYGPPAYEAVSPGTVTLYSGKEAGIIKAGITPDPNDAQYRDQGLFAFKVPNVDITTFAAQELSYVVQNQTGTNPVWVRIRFTDGTQYQFVPSPYSIGVYNTVDANAGSWQLMDNNGNATGSLMSLSGVASSHPGSVDRVYLTLGMGNSYNVSSGVGTVAWVDKVTLGGVTYDFVVRTATVHIYKYIDGNQATATSANSVDFPMVTTFTSTSHGNAIDAPFTLGAGGWGSAPAYQASFANANLGANYTTHEVTGDSVVGANCTDGKPFALVGYSTGDNLTDAQKAKSSVTVPNFTDLQSDHYMIVWNKTCPALIGFPTNKDQCKKDGWKTFSNPVFKNQGDCVSHVATKGKNLPAMP